MGKPQSQPALRSHVYDPDPVEEVASPTPVPVVTPGPAPKPVARRVASVPTVPLMIRVPLELREDLKEFTFARGVTMQDYVVETLTDRLKKDKRASA